MKVILLEDIKSLGKIGDIKNVADGYATNCLIPQKLAVVASNTNIVLYRNQKVQAIKKVDAKQESYQKIMKTLDKQTLEFSAKVSENDNLFKAISNKDVILAVKDKFNLDLEIKWFKKAAHLKKLGKHKLSISFPDNNKINLIVNIKSEK
ncbi:50S ribosomal protein L9 [bacterium]|jgi:large subunit ribosomal protein L9|nr:50S ribosomal protein L9 [bacterium]MBT4649037.1 50S ribosomal protein L9 [bacterium]